MEHDEGFITVVSGLPRSGTSMMMQMLQAGGMPILTDGVRGPDADNPRGYWEFEPVKKLPAANDWVALAVGKAVKVVHALIPSLPSGFRYRVILMRRDVREVVASQRVMLQRAGKAGADLSDERLTEIFTLQMANVVAWLQEKPECQTLEIEHRECMEMPIVVAAKVNRFLGGRLDEPQMSAAVDSILYRQRV